MTASLDNWTFASAFMIISFRQLLADVKESGIDIGEAENLVSSAAESFHNHENAEVDRILQEIAEKSEFLQKEHYYSHGKEPDVRDRCQALLLKLLLYRIDGWYGLIPQADPHLVQQLPVLQMNVNKMILLWQSGILEKENLITSHDVPKLRSGTGFPVR